MKLYEYKGIYWNLIRFRVGQCRVVPHCPIHFMELNYNDYSGVCEDCNKRYEWLSNRDHIAEYLRRKVASEVYRNAEIISIDGIQTPQIKLKLKIPDENKNYWIEGRLNTSNKGKQLVLYVGEKNITGKAQIFANLDQEKLSFDHKDRKPEEIISKITVEFPSTKKMIIYSDY